MRVEVPQLAEALARANAEGRGAVGPYSQRRLDPLVPEQGLIAEALPGPAGDSREFSSARTESHPSLRGCPVLDSLAFEHWDAA